MLTKDMRLPESEEDLPSTDLEQRVSMAERYSQLGESAAGALLASTLGSLPAGHPCCVLLDASPKSGEFARTVLKSPESSTAWHYVALAPENLGAAGPQRFCHGTLPHAQLENQGHGASA